MASLQWFGYIDTDSYFFKDVLEEKEEWTLHSSTFRNNLVNILQQSTFLSPVFLHLTYSFLSNQGKEVFTQFWYPFSIDSQKAFWYSTV